MPADEVVELAVSCLEDRAAQLQVQLFLFAVPAEMYGGSDTCRKAVQRHISGWAGVRNDDQEATSTGVYSPEVLAEMEKIKAEVAAQFPFMDNKERLDEVWKSGPEAPALSKREQTFRGFGLALPPGILW